MDRQALSVSELTKQIKYALELDFDRVLVRGELSNIAFPRSGHVYFNIKDDSAQIASVMFRPSAQRVKFDLENGLEVLLKGRITVYEPRGQYQLIVDKIEPLGAGALQLAFEQLKAKLAKEGLFDSERKQALPFIPKGIGIVTSSTGAAVRDILNILERRFPNIPVLLNSVAVQGESAAREIAHAIQQFQSISDIDVLIVGRGGGSIEDLWSFNEEIVARAIFASKIPVISAVGHETDFTIADFVADLRAPTPSAAAELSVPLKTELEEKLDQFQQNLHFLITRELRGYQERLGYLKKRLRSPEWLIQAKILRIDELTKRLDKILSNQINQYGGHWEKALQNLRFRSPLASIENKKNRVKEFSQRLDLQLKRELEKKKNHLAELTHVLDSVNPLSVLNRGYSVATDVNHKPITSIRQLVKNSSFFVHVSDGTIHSKVEKTTAKKSSA